MWRGMTMATFVRPALLLLGAALAGCASAPSGELAAADEAKLDASYARIAADDARIRQAAAQISEPVEAPLPELPAPTHSLDDARATYRLAAAETLVQLRASVELAAAERALSAAERARRDRRPAEVSRQAYLAQQWARIAMKTADYRQVEARVATSSETNKDPDMRKEPARVTETMKKPLAPALEAQADDMGPRLKRLQSEVGQLGARQTGRGWVLTLANDRLFDSGKATLKAGGRHAADKLAQFMREHSDRDIAIEGFTDSSGADEAKRTLSVRRAEAVKQALVRRGIDPERIDARGYGAAFPVASNDTPEGRQLNRRVEIIINPS